MRNKFIAAETTGLDAHTWRLRSAWPIPKHSHDQPVANPPRGLRGQSGSARLGGR
jgi:hypothetical protein